MRKMKRGIIAKMALGLFLLFVSMPLMAQEYRSDYLIRDGQVFYDYVPMETADFRTFRVLGKGYAKDRYHVYLDGTFRLLGEGYAPEYEEAEPYGRNRAGEGYFKSNFDVFYNGHKLEGASASTFREIGAGYAKDAFRVYYRGRLLEDATSSTFREIGGGYAKDSFRVYYCGRELADASASTFVYSGKGYGRDTFNTYFLGRKISDRDSLWQSETTLLVAFRPASSHSMAVQGVQ